jgi:protein-tyrosine-phosphatase
VNHQPLRVLFLCTGNSARSQMAEALLRYASHDAVEVSSAGSLPRPEIHPLARRAMRDLYDLDMAGQHPKPLEVFLDSRFDYVITVCDRAAESCPTFPGAPEVIRWSFEDPAAIDGTDEEKHRAFERTAKDLMGRIRLWLSLSSVSRRLGAADAERAI